jgi:hypothetical protein
MSDAEAESWDAPLRRAAAGASQAGVETFHGARPALLHAESAACLTSLILAGFVCTAAAFRTRLAAGQLDLISSVLRVAALAFAARALLALGLWLRQLRRDRAAARASLVLGPDGLLLRSGAIDESVRRDEVLDVVAPEALPSRALPAPPQPVLLVLTPRAGRPRVLRVPPYFTQTSAIALARLRRWLGTPSATPFALAPDRRDEAPESHYVQAAAGRLDQDDVVIPEGRGYLLRAPWAALLGLCFAADVYVSAGAGRALIAMPVLGAALLSVTALVSWFTWLRRRRKSRLGIGMLLSRRELLLRGPHGVIAVPWPQLSQVEVLVSARWSPFLGSFATRLLSLSTHAGEHMRFDESFLGTPVDAVAVLCRSATERALHPSGPASTPASQGSGGGGGISG